MLTYHDRRHNSKWDEPGDRLSIGREAMSESKGKDRERYRGMPRLSPQISTLQDGDGTGHATTFTPRRAEEQRLRNTEPKAALLGTSEHIGRERDKLRAVGRPDSPWLVTRTTKQTLGTYHSGLGR